MCIRDENKPCDYEMCGFYLNEESRCVLEDMGKDKQDNKKEIITNESKE